MALEIKINLNDYVWVELTDYGWETIRNYFEELFKGVPFNGYTVDDYVNGYKKVTKQYWVDRIGGEKIALTKFQLHDMMHLLGPKTYMGNTNCINNNTIYFTIDNFIEDYEVKDTESNS